MGRDFGCFEFEGGSEAGGRKAFWWTDWLLGGKDPLRGKHRTEVSEVTEADLRLEGATLFSGLIGFGAGKTRTGESLTEIIVKEESI